MGVELLQKRQHGVRCASRHGFVRANPSETSFCAACCKRAINPASQGPKVGLQKSRSAAVTRRLSQKRKTACILGEFRRNSRGRESFALAANRSDFWSYAKALLLVTVIFVFVAIVVPSAHAAPQTIPVENLKVYQLIDLWDAVPPDTLTYGDNPVRSFRDVDYTYTRQKGLLFSPTLDDAKHFESYLRSKEYVQDLDSETFGSIESKIFVWSVHLANKNYPNYNADMTQSM